MSIGGRARLCAYLIAAVAGITGLVVIFLATDGSPPAAAATATAPACTSGTTVNTRDGAVCGLTANGVTSYLGVPYAAPPLGNLRWRPPARVAHRSTTLQATQAGLTCPQPGVLGSTPPPSSEDCLTLNVQVPTNAGSGPLPVMVEIHGGGFVQGTPADQTVLASKGNVIAVGVNYRLGVLGFLAEKALGEHSGDYGLMDQQAALKWVKQNISNFGGDPDNVTLFGQSAGGASVCDAAASPTAAGLFQKGISESGFYGYWDNTIWPNGDCKSSLETEQNAQADGATLAARVGCATATDVAECLRNVPVQTLLDEGSQVFSPTAGGTIAPTINGTTLPISAAQAIKTGKLNNVKLMIGVARDEFNGGETVASSVAQTPAQYKQLVRQQFGSLTSTIMTLYPIVRFPDSSPFIAYRTVMADSASVCPALQANQQLTNDVPTFAYENDDSDTPTGSPFPLGAFHNAENPFLFQATTATFTPDQSAMGDQIIAEWAGFARTGNPTVVGAPEWTRYTAKRQNVMSLESAGDSSLVSTKFLNQQHHCGFWDAVNQNAPWTNPAGPGPGSAS
jgi:para-nitrobenzyl esterase